jgi:hypothetical protein
MHRIVAHFQRHSKMGKQGTPTHKGNHEINFEYSSFKSILVKRDIIDQFLLIGDVVLPQVPPIAVAHATHYTGATTRTASAISATTNNRTAQPSVPLLSLPNITAVTPTLPPLPTMNAQSTIASVPETNLTPHPYLPSLSRSVVRILTRVSTNESGDCPESESDDEDSNRGTSGYSDPLVDGMWGSHDGADTYCPWEASTEAADEEEPCLRDLSLRDNDVEEHHGLVWKRDGALDDPNKMALSEGRLIPEKARSFKTPLHSFMSIFPLVYWKIVAEQINEYAALHSKHQFLKNGKRTISGAKRAHDTTYQEIIHFYGLLIFMCLYPFPGATYTVYWDYGYPLFPWTMTMQIRRFQQLRSVLHFNSNDAEVQGNGALRETRPLLNILKKTMGAYMIPGSELSLDETSAASISRYDRHIVFYNPAKNCGKFRFQFYILADASTFAPLALKVATRNDSDSCDPNDMLESIQEESKYSDLNKLVLHMCKKYNDTGRTFNMDNYYTSSLVRTLLRNRGFFHEVQF